MVKRNVIRCVIGCCNVIFEENHDTNVTITSGFVNTSITSRDFGRNDNYWSAFQILMDSERARNIHNRNNGK